MESNTCSNVRYEEIVENLPHSLLNITVKEYLSSLNTYRNTDSGKNVLVNENILQPLVFQSIHYGHPENPHALRDILSSLIDSGRVHIDGSLEDLLTGLSALANHGI